MQVSVSRCIVELHGEPGARPLVFRASEVPQAQEWATAIETQISLRQSRGGKRVLCFRLLSLRCQSATSEGMTVRVSVFAGSQMTRSGPEVVEKSGETSGGVLLILILPCRRGVGIQGEGGAGPGPDVEADGQHPDCASGL